MLKKAQERDVVDILVHDLRDYAHDKHRTVDDSPYGGGAGMVLKPEPVLKPSRDLRLSAHMTKSYFSLPTAKLLIRRSRTTSR